MIAEPEGRYIPPEAKQPESLPEKPMSRAAELLARQREYQSARQAEEAQKNQEVEAHSQRQAEIQEMIQERERLIQELESVGSGIEQMENGQIQQRMEIQEHIQQNIAQLEENIGQLEGQIQTSREEIETIREGLKEFKPEEIDPEVTAALTELEQTFTGTDERLRSHLAALERNRELILPSEQVEAYQSLLARREEIQRRLEEIESDDNVKQSLEEQLQLERTIERDQPVAEEENKWREAIVGAAIRMAGSNNQNRHDPVREQIIKDVTQQFITEEWAKRRIHELPAQDQIKAIRETFYNGESSGQYDKFGLVIGFEQDAPTILRLAQEKGKNPSYALAGVALRNMLGRHGTLGGTVGFLAMSEMKQSDPYRMGEQREKNEVNGLNHHLSSINLLRAYTFGLGQAAAQEIFPSATSQEWADFDRSATAPNMPFRSEPNGPIYPSNATEEEVKQIRTEFESARERAHDLAREKRQTEIEQLEHKQHDLQQKITKIEAYETIHSPLQDRERLEKEWRSAHESNRTDFSRVQSELAARQQELGQISRFNVLQSGRRRQLEGTIGSLQQQLEQTRGHLEEAETWLGELENMRESRRQAHEDMGNLSPDHRRNLQIWLEQTEARLAQLRAAETTESESK